MQGLQKQFPELIRTGIAHLIHSFFRAGALLIAVGGNETRCFHFLQMVIDRGQFDLCKVLHLLLHQLFDLIAMLRTKAQKQPKNVKRNHKIASFKLVSAEYHYTQR